MVSPVDSFGTLHAKICIQHIHQLIDQDPVSEFESVLFIGVILDQPGNDAAEPVKGDLISRKCGITGKRRMYGNGKVVLQGGLIQLDGGIYAVRGAQFVRRVPLDDQQVAVMHGNQLVFNRNGTGPAQNEKDLKIVVHMRRNMAYVMHDAPERSVGIKTGYFVVLRHGRFLLNRW